MKYHMGQGMEQLLVAEDDIEDVKESADGKYIAVITGFAAFDKLYFLNKENEAKIADLTIDSGDRIICSSFTKDGKYLIVYEGGMNSKGAIAACAFNGALDLLDAVSNSISVSPDGGQIESNSTTDAAAFTFTASTGAFLGTGGKYFGHSKNENKLTSSATPLKNTVSIASDGSADIICEGGAYLRYNYSSDQMRFRFYKSSSYTSQQPIALYKLSD